MGLPVRGRPTLTRCSEHGPSPLSQDTSNTPTSRRHALLSGIAAAPVLLSPLWPAPSTAWILHSKRSHVPCSLTVRNRSPWPVEALWVNYDGDEEPYTTIPPGYAWTVDTYESHPWRFRDARTGRLVREYVAGAGHQLLQLLPPDLIMSTAGEGQGQAQAQAEAQAHPPEDAADAGGFDGLAHPASQYTRATLLSVTVLPGSDPGPSGTGPSPGLGSGPEAPGQQAQPVGVVVLGLAGYPRPLSLLLGLPEARLVVNAAGAGAGAARGRRGRRPSLLATWADTLRAVGASLERVVITRQVGGVFYARILLRVPAQRQQQQQRRRRPSPGSAPPDPQPDPGAASGSDLDLDYALVSVDSRPSTALALALEAGADIYVALPIAEQVQRQYQEAERQLPELLLPPLPSEESVPGADFWSAPSA